MANLSSCSTLACKNPLTHLIINEQSGLALSALCGPCTSEMTGGEGVPPGFKLEAIPETDFPPIKQRQPKQGEFSMTTPTVPPPVANVPPEGSVATAPASALAPPDAIYDDVPGPYDAPTAGLSTDEASTNFFWTYGKGEYCYKLQTTVRGLPDLHKLQEHISTVVSTLSIVNQSGGKATETVTSPVPAPTTAPSALPPPTTQPTSPTPTTENEGVFIATKLAVTIRPDGKTQVGLYGTGDKYARCVVINTSEAVANAFAKCGAWQPQHFAGPATYNVNIKVSWRNSEKLNANGKPYKNVTSLDPA